MINSTPVIDEPTRTDQPGQRPRARQLRCLQNRHAAALAARDASLACPAELDAEIAELTAEDPAA